MKILLVCTGNTCRSAMAQGILEKILNDNNKNDTVTSAGISVYEPSCASKNAILALKDMEIDISSHISKALTPDMVEKADLVLTMTNAHRDILKTAMENCKNKIFTLGEYAYDKNEQVPDPYGMDIDAYKECAVSIENALEAVYKKIYG